VPSYAPKRLVVLLCPLASAVATHLQQGTCLPDAARNSRRPCRKFPPDTRC